MREGRGVLSEMEMLNKYLDDPCSNTLQLLSELQASSKEYIREQLDAMGLALVSTDSDDSYLRSLVTKFTSRLKSEDKAIAYLARHLNLDELQIREKLQGRGTKIEASDKTEVKHKQIRLDEGTKTEISDEIVIKRKRVKWDEETKNSIRQMIKDGLTINEITEHLGLPLSERIAVGALCTRLRKELGLSRTRRASNQGNEQVSTITENVDKPILSKQDTIPDERSTTDTVTIPKVETPLGGDLKGDSVTKESMYHEYVCKIKSLDSMISVKLREIAMLKALRVEYAKLCDGLKPGGGSDA